MKIFSTILEHGKIEDIEIDELKEFREKTKKSLPREVAAILDYCISLNITSKEEIDDILNANKSQLQNIAKNLNGNPDDLIEMQKLMKKSGTGLLALPYMMDEETRTDFMRGNKSFDDVTLDLESDKGRRDTVKQFMPLVHKIVYQFEGKSSLSRSDLLSCALEGLTMAMNTYRKPSAMIDNIEGIDTGESKKQKRTSFKTYASYQIAQAILREMNDYSRIVRIPQSLYQKNIAMGRGAENFNTMSIDSFSTNKDGDDIDKIDRMVELGYSDVRDVEKRIENTLGAQTMNNIFDMIDKKFSQRNAVIFYKRFGLNGYKQSKPTEIAKEFGLSINNVSTTIKNITKYLKETPRSYKLLQMMFDIYAESLLVDNFEKNRSEILETLYSDDVYMLLEELTHFNNPNVLITTILSIVGEYDKYNTDIVMNCLNEGIDWLDNNYHRSRRTIVRFLEQVYPTESFSHKGEDYIIETMNELIGLYKELDIEI